MSNEPVKNHRQSIRLKGYDYSIAGLYFITICTHNRAHLFGEIVDRYDNGDIGTMVLNDAGKMARQCWSETPIHFPNVILHQYVIMPNHIHGILEIVGANKHSPNVGAKYISPNDGTVQYSPNNNHSNGMGNISPINIDISNRAKNVSMDHIDISNRAKSVSPLRSPSQTIGSVVRGFKIGVTKWMRQNTNVIDVWQRNYYEHIIRDPKLYSNISEYILTNPRNWNKDSLK